ncbi:hypothetical protein PILCRDRAFT_812259 [Piloderma croceum F 1598]|uniref:F-box domain-containing protein n=1 Tax=Piloderma croceum (strain F 1598) TaxID=765440 RepID=A0A0C3GIP1_PILCF|nr:hypothetical protein PILCRDRAFT_812259 [Piloderma croceum F 1598]
MSQNRIRSPYEIAFRQAFSEITILDHAQNDLLQRLSHVRAWRQQKSAQLTRLMHVNSLISRIPNDTLAFIFETVHQDAITVSHVSRQWRHLAIRLPSLWRNISLGLCSDQIEEYLNRSQPLSLAITFVVADKDLRDKYSNPREAFMARLTMLLDHVSRWHSFRVDCLSRKTMYTVLGYLGGLSAPCLTHVSVQLPNIGLDNSPPEWHAAIFRTAPLLRTVDLRGITLSNCFFPPPDTLVELKVDARDLSFGFMNPKVFTHMPNLRVADVRGPLLSLDEVTDPPLTHLTLEQLTWGCFSIESLFASIVTPALRYLCLTRPQRDDLDYDYDSEEDDDLQNFPDAITNCPRIPILPNLDELHYDVATNYAADCIFVGLPKVSIVQFPLHVDESGRELCNSFFKALADDPSRWPHLTTIGFEGLPASYL